MRYERYGMMGHVIPRDHFAGSDIAVFLCTIGTR